MQEARSMVTGEIVTAWDFSRLPPTTITAQRRQFICIGCGGAAHFRRASSNGHEACFVGRPHAPNCELAVQGDGPWGPEGDEIVARWQADRQRIKLALAATADEPNLGGDGSARAERGGGRHVGGGEPKGTTIQRGPKRLLHLLVTSMLFRTSGIEMVLPDGGSMPAHSFFVSFSDATSIRHEGNFHGFWGIPARAATWLKDGSIYLNSTSSRDGSKLAINVSAELIPKVCGRLKVGRIADLKGRYVLVFGVPYITSGGQFTLYLRDANYIAALDPGELNR